MVDCNASFLGINSGSQHFRTPEQYTNFALVHIINHSFASLVRFGFLNKAYFVSRDSVVIHQFTLYLRAWVPFSGFVSTQIGENKLSSLVLIELCVVIRYHFSNVRSLIIHMVAVLDRINQSHIKRHFAGIVRCNQHLCFLFLF